MCIRDRSILAPISFVPSVISVSLVAETIKNPENVITGIQKIFELSPNSNNSRQKVIPKNNENIEKIRRRA